MTFRSSRKSTADKAKEAVTEQVSDRTDDLVAALDAAKEALARASAAASRKGAELGAELGKQASEAADKLLPERARQRRREAARRRNRRLLAGAAGITLLGVAFSRLAGAKGGREQLEREAGRDAGWVAESTSDAGPAPSADVTQLHGNGSGADTARTPPAN
ncbi:MAG TPA: hypothetical protein VHK02_16030 [Actinomycetota bacterium]|jgi:hypothetical protein|nr:hypothetical protein [Actinomycetota bacterium]